MPVFKTLPLILIPLFLCSCIPQEYVDAPPVNPQISNQVGSLTSEGPTFVACEGPEDELLLLGTLCGVSTLNVGWSNTDTLGSGMATAVGNEGETMLIIANQVDRTPDYVDNVASEVAHAAYIVLDSKSDPSSSVDRLNQWHKGEAVDSGAVVTAMVKFDACSGASWIASATFTWRNTEIKLQWVAGAGC